MKFHCVGAHRSFLRLISEKLGSEIHFEERTADAADLGACDAILFELQDSSSVELLDPGQSLGNVLRAGDDAPVVVFLPSPDRSTIQMALASGAYDYFTFNMPLEEISFILRRAARFRELTRQRRPVHLGGRNEAVANLTTSPAMSALMSVVKKVAPTDAPVLITGESGTGKEVMARAIHDASTRASHQFMAVACSSLPETLIEAELFGHEKGAFTGANAARPGRFEAVGNGTLLLDEIGELSPALQVKLLRALQERKFERIGSNVSRPIHARLLYATNRDLRAMIKAGQFRQDFFYRVSTVELHIPPLRQRRGDILALAQQFLRGAAERMGLAVPKLSPGVLVLLQEYDWPGNIRQLQNVIERALLLSEDGLVRISDLPPDMVPNSAGDEVPQQDLSLEEKIRLFKKQLIERALVEHSYNKVHAARALGIARSSLHRLIEELGIHADPTADAEIEQPFLILRKSA